MTTQERFATEHGMPILTVHMLVERARRAGRANEGASNGDRHRNSDDRNDKNANAREWERDLERETEEIRKMVAPYGFTEVVYTGLGPTLKRGEQYVEIPY